MSRFICKSILSGRYGVRDLVKTTNSNACYTLRWFSIRPNQHSFTVSYLMKTLGFSQNTALAISKHLSLKTPYKADRVIELFRTFGFTQTQISRLVRSLPQLLTLDAKKILLPKLEFLESKGISRPEIVKVITPFPSILGHSLDRQIAPGYEFILNFFKSNDKAVMAVKKHPNILLGKYVGNNIAILQEYGVTNSNIAALLQRQPKCFLVDSDKFREVVEEVVAMGFNAARMRFVVAVMAFRSTTRVNREVKVETYKNWGLSSEEFLEAFKREPRFLLVSKDKITACMDFVTNKMGWDPCVVVNTPLIVALSLKKRVIPRCLVYQHLLSKGLVKKPSALSSILYPMEKIFLEKFVDPYEDDAPELLKLYQEKLLLSKG